jgi:6-pyruvoyltetrahydropterin/6-carboxytetrahydropterin synthase
MASSSSFDVRVSKDTFKFNAAHFVAFENYRERLHGHNYRVSLRLVGSGVVGRDGYVVDFGLIKDVCKAVCKRLNEHFLCPLYSDVLDVAVDETTVRIKCHVDGSVFVFPRNDVFLLPIVHATAEEIAIYLWSELLEGFRSDYLIQRGIQTMEVTVAEAPGQEATFRLAIADAIAQESENGQNSKLDVRKFITQGELVPMPCLKDNVRIEKGRMNDSSTTATSSAVSCADKSCRCRESSALFSQQMKRIAQAINDGTIQPGVVSATDLEEIASGGAD